MEDEAADADRSLELDGVDVGRIGDVGVVDHDNCGRAGGREVGAEIALEGLRRDIRDGAGPVHDVGKNGGGANGEVAALIEV
jgi:hypothetical protein